MQPPIAVLSNTIHNFLVKLGVCRKVVRRFDMANPTGVTISVPGTTDQHDMERRRYLASSLFFFNIIYFNVCFRQIALKALSERLSKSHAMDKVPLIPKANKVVMPPSLTHGAPPTTPHPAPTIAVPVPVPPTQPNQ